MPSKGKQPWNTRCDSESPGFWVGSWFEIWDGLVRSFLSLDCGINCLANVGKCFYITYWWMLLDTMTLWSELLDFDLVGCSYGKVWLARVCLIFSLSCGQVSESHLSWIVPVNSDPHLLVHCQFPFQGTYHNFPLSQNGHDWEHAFLDSSKQVSESHLSWIVFVIVLWKPALIWVTACRFSKHYETHKHNPRQMLFWYLLGWI